MQLLNKIREIFKGNLVHFRAGRPLKLVAAECGIPYRTYQNMEGLGVIPQDETLDKLAKYHRVPETRFFLDPALVPAPPPTLDSLLNVIREQESRIRELEAQTRRSTALDALPGRLGRDLLDRLATADEDDLSDIRDLLRAKDEARREMEAESREEERSKRKKR
jgi:hypothetical protein